MEIDCEKQPCDEVKGVIGQTEAITEFDTEMILWISANFTLVIFIIAGNLLTILAIRICRRLRAVVSNLFILSLAVSDMIVGLSLPYHMAFYLGSSLGQSHMLCLLRFYIIIFACCISIWNLVAIAVDRYIAIVYPLHYRRYMTRRVAVIIIIIGWFIGTFVACIPIFWNHWQTAVECEFDQVLPAWYMAGIVTPGFLVIWICMLLVYWRIWQEASKQAKQLRKATCSHVKDGPSDWKSVQVVFLIMGSFTICWLPYFAVAVAQLLVSYDTSPVLYKSALALAMSNSGLNPIIYAWKNKNFRRSFALLLRCKSPNGSNCSEYSAREHCPRAPPQCHQQTSTEMPTQPVATIDVVPKSHEIISCSPLPTAVAVDTNLQVVNELSAVQLFHCVEINRNQLPIFAMMSNESCMPNVICTSCTVCKLVLRSRPQLSDQMKGAIVPWKCGEYNHHIINTIKCRW